MSIEYFDKQRIRKNKRGLGKSRAYSLTLTEDTYSALLEHTDKGRGLYGSAVIELSTRLMLALVSDNPELVDIVAAEVLQGVRSPYFARNLTRFYKIFIQ